MKRTLALWGLLLVGLATAGCAPDPKHVCEHEMKVYEGSSDKPHYLNDMDSCKEAYETKKTRRGVNAYRREVECVLGSDTQYKIRTCQQNEERRSAK